MTIVMKISVGCYKLEGWEIYIIYMYIYYFEELYAFGFHFLLVFMKNGRIKGCLFSHFLIILMEPQKFSNPPAKKQQLQFCIFYRRGAVMLQSHSQQTNENFFLSNIFFLLW